MISVDFGDARLILPIDEDYVLPSSVPTGAKERMRQIAEAGMELTEEQFRNMLVAVRGLSYSFYEAFRASNEHPTGSVPSEIKLEFGLMFSGDVSLALAKAGTDASIKVTVAWQTPALTEGA